MRTEPFYTRYKCDGCNKTAKASDGRFANKPHEKCTLDPKGTLRFLNVVHRVFATSHDMMDHTNGACIACGTEVGSGIEPDAREYECEACGERKVYGLEELLLMGYVTIEDGDDE